MRHVVLRYPFNKYFGDNEEHRKWREELAQVNQEFFTDEKGIVNVEPPEAPLPVRGEV